MRNEFIVVTMSALSFASSPHTDTRLMRWRCWFAVSLVLVMFLAVVLGSFHHHSDLATHHDCAVCAAAHVSSTAPDSPTLPEIVLPVHPVPLPLLVLSIPVFRPTSHLRSRAPPQ
jgi:hypothetical protein